MQVMFGFINAGGSTGTMANHLKFEPRFNGSTYNESKAISNKQPTTDSKFSNAVCDSGCAEK